MINFFNISLTNAQGVDVTTVNVYIGLKVLRGRHWNIKKWRDDIERNSALRPKPRVGGTVTGFTDEEGCLVGDNSERIHETDRITEANGPGWAVVKWETGKVSIYPIGWGGLHTLCIA